MIAASEPGIACFSMESATNPACPAYAGGLGVLAGDPLLKRDASDSFEHYAFPAAAINREMSASQTKLQLLISTPAPSRYSKLNSRPHCSQNVLLTAEDGISPLAGTFVPQILQNRCPSFTFEWHFGQTGI